MDMTATAAPTPPDTCRVDIGNCLFSKSELLGWTYLLQREPDKAHRKHILRIAVQHGLVTDSLTEALSWAFGLEQE